MEITLKEKYILGVLLTLYGFIGIQHSNNQGFWHDEVHTFTFLKGISAYNFEGSTLSGMEEVSVKNLKERIATDEFISNFDRQIIHEGHPPLYFFLLKAWAVIFGYSEVALRAFSLLCGISFMLVLFNLTREKFEEGYLSWAIFSFCFFNPFLFYFFTEARMYALAFLLAILVIKYWIHYLSKEDGKRLFLFSLASTGLLYTHYYGLFFISTLFALDTFKNGVRKKIYCFIIPLVFFLPWGIIIDKQMSLHEVHWTDGAFSLQNSITEYAYGIIHLFSSPIEVPNLFEIVGVSIVLAYVLLLGSMKWRTSVYTFLFSIVYFLQIFIFDQILDHHTIAVPRYYIFLLIFFLLVIAHAFRNMSVKKVLVVTLIYGVIGLTSIISVFNQKRAPKQMYREAAAYIDFNHDPEKRIIVTEPRGAMAWGLSYYLDENFLLVPADNYEKKSYSKKAIYVDERLGVSYKEGRLHDKEQKKMRLIPFVGLHLYE